MNYLLTYNGKLYRYVGQKIISSDKDTVTIQEVYEYVKEYKNLGTTDIVKIEEKENP